MSQDSSPTDPFELLRRLWAPLGVPAPGLAAPTLDPEEVAKRIADLRAVEGWLQLNLNMVRMAITALEMQRAALASMRPDAAGAPAAGGPTAPSPDNPMMWPWALMQQALAPAAPAGPGKDAPPPPNSGKGKK